MQLASAGWILITYSTFDWFKDGGEQSIEVFGVDSCQRLEELRWRRRAHQPASGKENLILFFFNLEAKRDATVLDLELNFGEKNLFHKFLDFPCYNQLTIVFCGLIVQTKWSNDSIWCQTSNLSD